MNKRAKYRWSWNPFLWWRRWTLHLALNAWAKSVSPFYACPGCAIGFTQEEAEDGRKVCRNCGKCSSCCTCKIEQGDF